MGQTPNNNSGYINNMPEELKKFKPEITEENMRILSEKIETPFHDFVMNLEPKPKPKTTIWQKIKSFFKNLFK